MAVLSKFVVPGDKVELVSLKRGRNEDEIPHYVTRVYDVRNDDEVMLNMPMENGKLILLSVGAEYSLNFYTSQGLYQCDAVVTERYKSKNVFVVNMELITQLRKFQRREYYRLNCILDMNCKEISQEEIKEFSNHVEFFGADFTMNNGTIVDISGGGIRFVSKVKYEKNMHMYFNFKLEIAGQDVEFKTIGRIISSEKRENRADEFENRVQFVDVDSEDREVIIKYIFEEERKLRRKEKQ